MLSPMKEFGIFLNLKFCIKLKITKCKTLIIKQPPAINKTTTEGLDKSLKLKGLAFFSLKYFFSIVKLNPHSKLKIGAPMHPVKAISPKLFLANEKLTKKSGMELPAARIVIVRKFLGM